MTDEGLEHDWKVVVDELNKNFGPGLDLQGILFLIGVQEVGQGFRKFKKDEKLEVMHVAICTLLSRFGYYEYEGHDEQGWPHFKLNEKLPALKPAQQHLLIKQAIVEYFRDREKEA